MIRVTLRQKRRQQMTEYRENGCRLGWLIDPFNETTYIYHMEEPVTQVPFDQMLSGENILVGLSLRLADLFDE